MTELSNWTNHREWPAGSIVASQHGTAKLIAAWNGYLWVSFADANDPVTVRAEEWRLYATPDEAQHMPR